MNQAQYRPLEEAKQYCPTLALRAVNENGALLVDVRERDEVAALGFDVAGAVNLPMSEFERRYAELPSDCLLVLACATGDRSLKATYLLMYQGYSQVVNLDGGLAKWVRKGFPVHGHPADAVVVDGATSGGCC